MIVIQGVDPESRLLHGFTMMKGWMMRAILRSLSIVFCVLVILSCTVEYKRYLKITTSAENSDVIFSFLEEIAGEKDMYIGHDLDDDEGRTLFSFYKYAVFPSKKIWFGVKRRKIDKSGRITYLVSVGYGGGTQFPERERGRVDKYFDAIVLDIKGLENKGYLEIIKIH